MTAFLTVFHITNVTKKSLSEMFWGSVTLK